MLINRNIKLKKFDAVILLNGDIPDENSLNLYRNRKFIAVDGAANYLYRMGVVPDVIIGDLDSYKNEFEGENIEIVYEGSQEINDFEKALIYCIKNEYKEILIFGINGGELDHVLNNFSVIKKYIGLLDMIIFDNGRFGYLLREGKFEFEAGVNRLVSIIPFFNVRLQTYGLKWELNGEVLEFGVREGARNRSLGNRFSVEIKKGKAFLFV